MTLTDTMVGSSRLSAAGPGLRYDDRRVVAYLDLAVPDGKVTVIAGANGCGKSTLLRGLARLLKPASGAVLLDGHSIHHQPSRDVAKTLGLLSRNPVAPEGLTVVDLVGRGRHPHHGPLRRWSTAHDAAVARALELTDIPDLATGRSTSSRADSDSGSGSRWPSPRRPTCSSSTSPPPTST